MSDSAEAHVFVNLNSAMHFDFFACKYSNNLIFH